MIGVSIEGFDLVPVVLGGYEDAGSLGQRRHDLAGEAEDGGFVGWAVADGEGAAVLG